MKKLKKNNGKKNKLLIKLENKINKKNNKNRSLLRKKKSKKNIFEYFCIFNCFFTYIICFKIYI